MHTQGRRTYLFVMELLDGCNTKPNEKMKEKVFPCLLSKNSDIFSFNDSSFNVHKLKESTGRVVMWKEFNIMNSYTLEASFCGSDFGKFADYHFNTELLQEVGNAFCQTLYDMFDPDQSKVKVVLEELDMLYPKKDDDIEEINNNDSNADSDYSGDDSKKKKSKKKAKKKGKKDDTPKLEPTKEASVKPAADAIKKLAPKK